MRCRSRVCWRLFVRMRRALRSAQKVLLVLQMQLKQSLTRDELTYLTIHIARLARDMGH